MLKRIILFLSVICICSCETSTPTIGVSTNPNFIKGKVLSNNNSPIKKTNVRLYKSSIKPILIDSTVVNDKGEFTFETSYNLDSLSIEAFSGDSLKFFKNNISSDNLCLLKKTEIIEGKVAIPVNEDYRVVVTNTPYSTTINSDGTYLLVHIPVGEYSISIIKITNNTDEFEIIKEDIDSIEVIEVIEPIIKIAKTMILDRTNSKIEDTHISTAKTSSPTGTSQWVNKPLGQHKQLSSGTYDNFTMNKILIKFNIDSLLDTFEIDSAFIVLKIDTIFEKNIDTTTSYKTHALLKEWNEGNYIEGYYPDNNNFSVNSSEINGATGLESYYNVPWDSIGVALNDVDAQKNSLKTETYQLEENVDVKFPVTSILQQWVSNEIDNNGVIIVNNNALESGTTGDTFFRLATFFSSECDSTENGPKLIIHYKE